MQTSFPTIHEQLVELVTSRGFRCVFVPPGEKAENISQASFASGLVQLFAFSSPRAEWAVTWHMGPMRFYPHDEGDKAMDDVVYRLRLLRDETRRALGEWTSP